MPYSNPEDQRAANRRYYERNKGVYLAKNNKKRNSLREMVRQAKTVPCVDCGVSYPYYVMDFDHRDPAEKKYEVSRLVNRNSAKQLTDEMAKCDVVCANCHRIRTHSGVAER